MKMLFAFFAGLTFAPGTKPIVGKTARTLAQIIALVIAYFLPHTVKKKKSVSLTKSVVILMNFLL